MKASSKRFCLLENCYLRVCARLSGFLGECVLICPHKESHSKQAPFSEMKHFRDLPVRCTNKSYACKFKYSLAPVSCKQLGQLNVLRTLFKSKE